jgi:hypothetical protein
MNLRHAAALALVSWYLMLPPTNFDGIDLSAPLTKWSIYQEYDSHRECVAAWSELQNQMTPDAQLQFPSKRLRQFKAAQCRPSKDSDVNSN